MNFKTLLRKSLLVLGLFISIYSIKGDAPSWNFNLPHVGRVLYEGGWYQEYNLGVINGSPEFNFPLQLVYLSTRETAGMFGPQWFCPQLESTIIPQGVGGFTWQTPAGNVLLLRKSNPSDASIFSDSSGAWIAKVAPDHQEIRNQDGWSFAYNRGHLKSLTSPTGRILEFTWNGGDLQSMQLVDPGSKQEKGLIQVQYYVPHCASAIVCNGVEQDFTYQDKRDGRLDSWTLSDKEHLYFGYAEQGLLTHIQQENDPVQTFTTTIRDTQLGSSDKADPANWFLVQDPDNSYTYASSGRKKQVLLPNKITAVSNSGIKKTIDYNPQGGAIVEGTGADNTSTTTFYRAPGKSFDGKLKSVEQNGVITAEYTYDPVTGLLASITDNNGIATYFDYPAKWKKDWKNPWDPKPIRVWRGTKDNPEVIAQYKYDDSGRVTSTEDITGQVTDFSYTPRGELGAVRAPDGVVSALTYDGFGRCVQASVGDQSQSVEYDDLGRVKSQTAPDGSKTEFTYDEMGNVVQVTRNGKPIMHYLRDAHGTITGEQDSLGRIRKIDSDSRGNVLAEYAPDGSVTKYQYDRFNRRIAQIDGNGQKVSFTYDAGDHKTKQVNALGDTINWIYDEQNHLIGQENGVQQIQNAYNENGRIVSTDYGPGQKIDYTYDDHGRVDSMVTSASAFYYVYDKLGRIDAARAVEGHEEQLLRYRYNYSGQRTGLMLARYLPSIDPLGMKAGQDSRYEILQQTEYAYDNRRLTSIQSNGQPMLAYKYDAAGRPILKTYGNGIQATLSYDAAGHLARIIFAGGPIEPPLTLAYVWDSADQVVQRTWNGEVLRYQYDAGGRLAKVIQVVDNKTTQDLEAYAYDKAGNIIKKTLQGQTTTLSYNAANELTSMSSPGGSVSYSYDKAGRMLNYTGGPSNTYGWLDKVVKTTTAHGDAIAMTYWPDGQLASKGPAVGVSKAAYSPGQTDTEHFLWDGLALLRRNDEVFVVEPHPSGGVAVASHPIGNTGELTYYLNDLLGTTLAVVKGNQIVFNNLTSFGQQRRQAPTSIQPVSLAAPAAASPSLPAQSQLPPVR